MDASKVEYEVLDILKTVIDPELDINIIDLGFVYQIEFTEEKGIVINMTLTSEGCPMGDIILNNVESSLKTKFPDYAVTINLVWEPKWTTDRVTKEGRILLNMQS